MRYRAKCTRIAGKLCEIYNIHNHHIVKDATDLYIEVDFEDEAELIEKINAKALEISQMYNQLEQLRDE